MCFILERSYYSEYGQFVYIENNKNISITGWKHNEKHIKTMVIPDNINGKPVVSIGKKAFLDSYFTEIEIPDSVIKIGEKAFYGNELLEKVKLSSNLTKLNKELFCFCNLNSIIIPNKIKVIKSSVFSSNPLCEIFIGNKVILKKDSVDYCNDKRYKNLNETNFYSVYYKNNKKGGRYIKTENKIKDKFDEKLWHIQYIWKYQN
jgi:hypothetical protein